MYFLRSSLCNTNKGEQVCVSSNTCKWIKHTVTPLTSSGWHENFVEEFPWTLEHYYWDSHPGVFQKQTAHSLKEREREKISVNYSCYVKVCLQDTNTSKKQRHNKKKKNFMMNFNMWKKKNVTFMSCDIAIQYVLKDANHKRIVLFMQMS